MHPAHVPLEGESQATFGDGSRHLGPCGGLLRNSTVQLLDEFNRLQIFPAAEAVWNPFSALAAVVEVEHRSHRIHPQAVDVKLFQPVEGVSDEKVPHLS